MNLIVFNSPAGLPWQTNLCDIMLLTMFLAAVAYSVVQFRRGRRVYCALLAAAAIYGLVLELVGMATLNMYKQGDFMLMINWPAFPLWHGTTMMPAYVVIFYPVFLFTGFKVVEAIGTEKRWQGAVTGGLFMIALDAPYIIEGNLRHVVWWTWNPNFEYFQFWVGWPLLDLCWQGIWDAVFIYIMLWAAPRIDGLAGSGIARWSNAKAMGAFPPLAALMVLVTGPILMSPVTVVTALGGRQWPVVVMLVVGYCAVTVTALRSAKANPSFEPFTLGLVVLYVASLGAMVIANVVYERGLTRYILVQAVGLIVVSGLASFPWIATRGGSRELAGQAVQAVA
ncbi:hypothetical protein A5697_14630 [Mycobacterium sp. E3251]|uniref:hypothetical protein n=1 Tax=unclassified Mycobacterium TaxID=2642494 RepID=UPI0007FF0720|nr:MULTISPECIES: hypothetical protein [unclassified Mycobacterium]OBG99025.1 hypothetical protein A5697_14630 [Mycobacterium sp. E3251]OBI30352.1 hypothetical protein A5709_25785 [Mycobacterium sp. E1386]